MDDASLRSAILEAAQRHPRSDGDDVLSVPGHVLAALADGSGRHLRLVESMACTAGVWPERYLRNTRLLSCAEQVRLLGARVLLVGLGGLGGHVLDMLLRMGVGTIVGCDGDVFEESNLNRQLLSGVDRVGMPKAEAARLHAQAVNPAVIFEPVCTFLRGVDMHRHAKGADVVVDALGGLDDRMALRDAARAAGVPLVTAGVAGLSGWVATVAPEGTAPADLFGQGRAAEDVLGNFAPTVGLAASLQCVQVMQVLSGRSTPAGMLLFDLSDQTFVSLPLA